MAAQHFSRGPFASERPQALLLRSAAVSAEDEKLALLIDTLRVPWRAISPGEITNYGGWHDRDGEPPFVMSSASCLATLPELASGSGDLPGWMAKAASVYVYGFGDDAWSEQVLRFLTSDPCARVRTVGTGQSSVSISNDIPDMCGPMSGLKFQARLPHRQTVLTMRPGAGLFQTIASCTQGPLFVGVNRCGAQLFLSASGSVVDVAALCTRYFDVREDFCSTAPPVMYAKWAQGVRAPRDISACLIVDDPPLKPRYGFLKYQDALRLMDKHNFATTVAFIPWNWSRTDARTVRLFHNHPNRLSICVHGCDHTAGEFAERSIAVLNKRLDVANQRMRLLGGRTQLRYDEVMLYPQGAFSASAARALKLNGFVAAANTEVTPIHKDENRTTVGDVLGLAIMKYASFPMYTRRYLAHGVENFAFDGLLGKPCFIAAHHDDFAGDARILVEVIAKLNSLHWKLHWRSLGDAIAHSFHVSGNDDGRRSVAMYGTRLIYRNELESHAAVTFTKEEGDFEPVRAVTVNGVAVDYLHHQGTLRFETMVLPNHIADVRIVYTGCPNLAAGADGLTYRAKALLRRYLSEFRDNYLSRNTHLHQGAVRIKEALRL